MERLGKRGDLLRNTEHRSASRDIPVVYCRLPNILKYEHNHSVKEEEINHDQTKKGHISAITEELLMGIF